MNLKRDLVKYVRDRAKSKYDKGTECRICESTGKPRLPSLLRIDGTVREVVKREQIEYSNR